MNLDATDIVRLSDERPARRDGTCFYCRSPIGEYHAEGCVIVSRSVVLRMEIEVVIDVPRDWETSTIEFHHGAEGSRCGTNFIDTLEAWRERGEDHPGAGCLCPAIDATFLREATAEDHEELPVLISRYELGLPTQ